MGADLNSLEGVIRHTKRTILYFSPLDDPAPIKRVWCLYEILTVATTEGNELTLGFSSSGKKEMYKIAAAFAKVEGGASTVATKGDKAALAKQLCLSQKRAPSHLNSRNMAHTHARRARTRSPAQCLSRRRLQSTIDKLNSKRAQATVPADEAMIKGKIVKMFGGHKEFDLKLRDALTAAVGGYTSHVELVAAGRALGAGRIAASAKNKDSLKTFVQVLGRAGRRLLPPDPINLKCTHLDLSGMGPFTHEHGYGLAPLLRIDGSLIEVNLDGFALPIKTFNGTDPVESLDFSDKGLGVASAVVIASLISVNSSLMKLKCASCPAQVHLCVSAP